MDKVPTVYSEKAKGNNRRRLYRQFILYLRSHILFGQGTILLQLSLHDSHNDPNVLVVSFGLHASALFLKHATNMSIFCFYTQPKIICLYQICL